MKVSKEIFIMIIFKTKIEIKIKYVNLLEKLGISKEHRYLYGGNEHYPSFMLMRKTI